MLDANGFRDLVSGRRPGIAAAILRGLLRGAETPYRLAIGWRNRRFDRGRGVSLAKVPVVSVGNLTLGGTGKTPMVEWLARWFRARGVRVTLISRGYGATDGSRNDEALELEQKLPDVPHLQNPNRVEAAQTAIEEFDAQLLLLDDAFQHRSIARDLDLVMIDALEPDGFGHVFPRGTLREPLSGLARADVIVLSRADMIDVPRRIEIAELAGRYAADAVWVEAIHAPRALLSSGGEEADLRSLHGQRVAAFCGIGNPAGFRHTLASCGYEVVALREFPDHHDYRREDVESLVEWADSLDSVAAIVCTCKDLVKLRSERLGRHRLWALSIGLSILGGQEALEARLGELLPEVG